MTNFAESDHPRAAAGTFTEKTQSPATITLPEPFDGPQDELLTLASEHRDIGAITDAQRGPYAGSIVVTDEYGCEYLVMGRDAARDGFLDDVLEDGKSGAVDSAYLANATRITSAIFDQLKTLGEPTASERILNVLHGANAIERLADNTAAFDTRLGDWFSNYDGRSIRLDDNTFAFRRA
jgi:hypothetical protein